MQKTDAKLLKIKTITSTQDLLLQLHIVPITQDSIKTKVND